jgi:hopanoid C-3 methylase
VLTSRDYRLYDIQHAVMPTRLPLAEFYEEMVTTQRAFYRKFAGWRAAYATAGIVARQLLRGHPNFLKSLYLLDKLYRPELLLADHGMPTAYEIPLPAGHAASREPSAAQLYIHPPRGRKGRAIDAATENFVEATRAGGTP